MAMIGRPESSAIALPRPVVDPPPIATAQSAPSLRADIDPHALHLGVFAHRLEAHLATTAALADAAEGRARIDAFVAVDPDHAGVHVACDLVRALQVACPQAAAQAVLGTVGDRQR